MTVHRTRLSVVLCVVLAMLSTATLAADPLAPLSSIDLQDGDTLVFLGDSITHQCLYTQYIEDYYYTRYPDRRINFHNAGVSGDRADDAVSRFDADVAVFKPKYVTVLLGMNDGLYKHFDHETFASYEKDMTTVRKKIAAIGAKAILMGPTMYDSRVSETRPPRWIAGNPEQVKAVTAYYSAVLAFYGAWCRDQAVRYGQGYVDMATFMGNLTQKQQAENPKFTMIPDAVHPDAGGQAVMAFAVLDQMNAAAQVSAVVINQRKGRWKAYVRNGEVSDIKAEGDGLSFVFKAKALPWVLPSEAKLGYELTKAGHKKSNERITISGLKPGRYDLIIDDVVVGTYPHNRLAAKIELQSNEKTPQYQQALKVAMLNKERNAKAIRPLRGQWLRLRGKFTRPGKLGTEEYKKFKPDFDKKVAELLKLKSEYEDKIYKANQPVARTYRIKPSTAPRAKSGK
ncbi:MAG: SGNH/GDSL hydrolase family protein [Phycisphaerae bacterium]|jgi:lysophospholipase L1-like esterase|nr:SGNH/GDSL hydrolase family protein [Phycisphaerae bacterium]